jgi:AraC-like DNA-binding protein
MVQNGYYGDHLARTFRTDAKPPSVTRTLARATFAVTHFCCLDPPNEVTDTHGTQSAYSLAVHRRPLENYRLWIEGKPQPHDTRGVGAVTFFDLRQNKVALLRKPIDCMHYYIPRSALDYAAQQNGMPACGDLTTRFGANLTDPILNGISNTLFPATLHPEEVNELFFDYMILATLTHIATRYGEWSPTRTIAVGGLAPWQLRRAQQMIMGDLSGRLSLARIAAECKLSEGHFARAFAKSTGEPPHRWLMRRRIEQAKSLLLHSDTPIADIAQICGFADQSHLTRVFKSAVGASPARWRQQRRQ